MAIQEAHYHGRHEQRLASKAQSRTKAFRVLASRLEQMGTSVKIPSQYSIQNIQLTRITHSYRFLREHPPVTCLFDETRRNDGVGKEFIDGSFRCPRCSLRWLHTCQSMLIWYSITMQFLWMLFIVSQIVLHRQFTNTTTAYAVTSEAPKVFRRDRPHRNLFCRVRGCSFQSNGHC